MRSNQAGELLLAETAASAGNTPERAQSLLEVLRTVVPFDGAWLALADPVGHGYHSLASLDLDGPTVEFLSCPLMAQDIEVTGTDRAHPPLSPSDPPYPAEVRNGDMYRFEMTASDHDDLLRAVVNLKHAKAAISSYPSERYTTALKKWRCVLVDAPNSMSKKDTKAIKQEAIYMNYTD